MGIVIYSYGGLGGGMDGCCGMYAGQGKEGLVACWKML